MKELNTVMLLVGRKWNGISEQEVDGEILGLKGYFSIFNKGMVGIEFQEF